MARGKKKGSFKTCVKVLPVRLEDKEIQAKGEELADLEQQQQATKEEAAAQAARFRERSKALSLEIKKLTRQINSKEEEREVKCELIPDYKRNVMETVRADNGETVEERALTPDERQLELGAPKFPKPKARPVAKEGIFIASDPDAPIPYVTTGKGVDLDIEADPPLAPKKKRGRPPKVGRQVHEDGNSVSDLLGRA
jgi:hypothetical protein